MNEGRSTHSEKNPVGVLLLFVLLALAYSVVVPFGEPTDEPDHNAYVWYLLTHRRLPFQSPDPTLNPVQEGHHPPGYYAVVALLTGWAPYEAYEPDPNPYLPRGYDDPQIVQQFLHPASERFPWPGPLLAAHLARLVSIGMSVLSVWVTYQVGRQIAPHDPHVALLAAGTHAFIPQFVYMGSAINNDNAAILAGSLITWQMLRLMRRSTNSGFALLGLLMGLGMLSKVSLLAMFPAIGWTVWYAAARCGRDHSTGHIRWGRCLKQIGATSGLVLVPMLLLSGWWMWRNLRLYGDPLAWNIRLITYAQFERRLPITAGYVLRFLWQMFRSFWGLFGWSRVFLPSWLYLALLTLTLLGIAGFVKYLYALGAQRRDALARGVSLVLVLAGFLLSSWYQILRRDIVAAQGRFLFPALSATTTLLAAGWLAWRPSGQRARMARLGVGGLFTLAVAVLLLCLVPVYARPLLPALPAQAQPVESDFGSGLWELVGWQAPQPLVGRTWSVTLYWRAQRELNAEERRLAPILFVHLVDARGEVVAGWDGVPTGGRFPPPAWSPAVIVADTVRLPLPEQVQTGLAHLYVGFYFKEEDQLRQVTVHSSSHPTLPGTLLLGPVMLRSPQLARVQPQWTTQAQFGSTELAAMRLLGFDLEFSTAAGAEALRVVLYWQAEQDVTVDYTVFVHLVGAQGAAAQGDAPPCGGGCPTSLWQAGDVWRDEHLIPLASLSAAGAPYTLAVGWYEPVTGERLAAFSAPSQQGEGNRVPLCTFFTWPDGECVP